MALDLHVSERRYLSLLEQLRDELGAKHGWKTAAGRKLGISQSHVTQLLDGTKRPGGDIIQRAMEKLGLHRDFFFDRSLENPSYRDFIRVEIERDDDTPAWLALEEEGIVDSYRQLGLPEDRIQWVRRMPGARGGLRQRDYIEELDAALRRYLMRREELGPEPEPARRAREAQEQAGGPGGTDLLPDPEDRS